MQLDNNKSQSVCQEEIPAEIELILQKMEKEWQLILDVATEDNK